MPNNIALLVYWSWIPVCIFCLMRFRPLPKVASYLVLVTVLFLPSLVAIDLPALPPMNRERLTITILLITLMVSHPRRLLSARPGRGGSRAVTTKAMISRRVRWRSAGTTWMDLG